MLAPDIDERLDEIKKINEKRQSIYVRKLAKKRGRENANNLEQPVLAKTILEHDLNNSRLSNDLESRQS